MINKPILIVPGILIQFFMKYYLNSKNKINCPIILITSKIFL